MSRRPLWICGQLPARNDRGDDARLSVNRISSLAIAIPLKPTNRRCTVRRRRLLLKGIHTLKFGMDIRITGQLTISADVDLRIEQFHGGSQSHRGRGCSGDGIADLLLGKPPCPALSAANQLATTTTACTPGHRQMTRRPHPDLRPALGMKAATWRPTMSWIPRSSGLLRPSPRSSPASRA